MNQTEKLSANLSSIKQRIHQAALGCGRNAQDITLVAVTKTVPPHIINQAISLGVDSIGENRVQELQQKLPDIKSGVDIHLIGHLQTNKVKYIIDKVSLIHSVDSLKLAEEIDKRAAAAGKVMDILIEVNVSGEQSKYGISESFCNEFVTQILHFNNIRLKGLMTIAPDIPKEETRKYFKKLNQLRLDIIEKNRDNVFMQYLSMGMTNDFEVAIEEGANMVRIGSALFGGV